jgi:serine/threonine protein kinase
MGELEARYIICQLVNSINYCHTRGIIHRDLKLENVIFRDPIESDNPDLQELFVKVIDFGIAGVCETGKSDKGDAGSLCYMAPECLKGKAAESAPAIDVWAIGIMFYSLLQGTLPFYASDDDETVKLIKTAPIKFARDIPVTPMARDIIKMMLEKDPSARVDLMDVMDMEFFRMDDEEYKKKVDDYKVEFHRSKEEQKTEEKLAPPISKP